MGSPDKIPALPVSESDISSRSNRLFSRWWVRWGLILGAWTFIGLLEASLSSVLVALSNKTMPLWRLLVMGVFDWYIWAALTPLVLWGIRRCPIEQRNWLRPLIVHLIAGFLFAIAVIIIQIPILELINPAWVIMSDPVSPFETFTRLLTLRTLLYMLAYWAVVGLVHAAAYYRKFREHEMHALVLESQLAQAQFQMLRMQLQPHFLFNTLNAISALMHQNVELADQMLARLADLLRSTLETAGTQEVPLKQELEFIELYLEIEQARLGPRLVVRLDADPETMDAYVPNLILQPLVENAIRHGIAPRPGTGHIEILARRENGTLQVQVLDDGPGLKQEALRKREGVGLANTRARLLQLYGDRHRFVAANRPEGGFAATMHVPFREHADEELPVAGQNAALSSLAGSLQPFRGIASPGPL
jgi:signal transduction histidine kinase